LKFNQYVVDLQAQAASRRERLSMYTRVLERPIRDALGDRPVVLIHGPRHSGKTTLAEVIAGERGRQRLSLDRTSVLAAARDRFHRGVVLYCGGETVPFGEGLWAVPIGALWSE
jgi:predicted AAA+ superfamily ATPase